MRHERIDASPAAAARALAARYRGLTAPAMLRRALTEDLPGEVALLSSFGADSAVLLHMVAEIDRRTPVLFLETGLLFPETLAYRAELVAALGLQDVRALRPTARAAAARDPSGDLHARDPDACCALRKTEPLAAGLAPFRGWITGRRRDQTRARAAMPAVEIDRAGLLKLNPLAHWTAAELRAYREAAALPPHPMVARGFRSIGCAPCTTATRPEEDPRAGRWRGRAKQECGIHIENGVVARTPSDAAAMDRM